MVSRSRKPRQVEERRGDARLVQPRPLLDKVVCGLPLLHKGQDGVIAAFGADADVAHAARSKLFELRIGFGGDVRDSTEPPITSDLGHLCLNRIEYLKQTSIREREGIASHQVDTPVELRRLCGELIDVLQDLGHRRGLEPDAVVDVAEVAFPMRAATGDLKHGTHHVAWWAMLRFVDVHGVPPREIEYTPMVAQTG